MSNYKVCKFGGSSMACGNQIKKAADIVLSDKFRKIVIVSAPGKRTDEDFKVTDMLIKLAENLISHAPYRNIYDQIITRYVEIITDLQLGDKILELIKEDFEKRISRLNNLNPLKFFDLIKASGEDNMAKVFACYLQKRTNQATYINPYIAGMTLSDEPGNGRLLKKSYESLSKLEEQKGILVFPGFFGYNEKGEVITFARGGSDITGSILAASIDAEIYENFTDVDNVFVANPKLVKNPDAIHSITYREMRELSYAGFSVLHEETLEPIYKKSIPVHIKNTNNCNAEGTIISCDYPTSRKNYLAGIAGKAGFTSIFISKYLMNREVGFLRQLLQIFEDEHISFDHTPTGIDNISIILESNQFYNKNNDKILFRIKDELGVDSITINDNISLISLVDEKILEKNILSRATSALSDNNIDVLIASLCTNGVSLMIGVKDSNLNEAINQLYKEFF